MATAVLALLSAGSLATLGVVTAGELREVGRGLGHPSKVDGVGPPAPIALTPTPAPTPARGGGSGGAGGGRAAGGVETLPETVVTGSSTSTPSAPEGGLPTPTPRPGPAAPTTPGTTPAGPVFAGVTPTPVPSAGVLAEKKGRHLGQLGHAARTAKPAVAESRAKNHVSTPRGRAVGHDHGRGKPAVAPVGPPTVSPSPAVAEHAAAPRGQGKAKGHAKRNGPAAVPVPFSPALTSTPIATPTTVVTPGTGEGKHNGKAVGHSR